MGLRYQVSGVSWGFLGDGSRTLACLGISCALSGPCFRTGKSQTAEDAENSGKVRKANISDRTDNSPNAKHPRPDTSGLTPDTRLLM